MCWPETVDVVASYRVVSGSKPHRVRRIDIMLKCAHCSEFVVEKLILESLAFSVGKCQGGDTVSV